MIPKFPEFKKLELSDKDAIEEHTKMCSPYSDFNFTSLWAWDTSDKRMISEINGNLAVQFTDYSSNEPFLSFLGVNETEYTARELIRYAEAFGISPILRLLPEEAVASIKTSVLNVEEDKDNFDYIYTVPELATLGGQKFKEKRQAAARFLRRYPEARFEIANLSDIVTQNFIMSVLRSWEDRKKSENKIYELEHEETALKRLLNTANAHELVVAGVFFGDAMIGFSIDEILSNQYCVEHFSKAYNEHIGVYDFLNLKMALHLEANNVALWNWEQDLGIESLRRSKMSYRPVHFLKKYIVSLANGGVIL